MSENNFSREGLKKEVAKGNLSIDTKLQGKNSDAIIKKLMDYQFKTNIIQYISAGIMLILGILISFINENGVGVTIGSLVQGDTVVSNITVNLGALLIFGSFYVFLNVVKNSNTNYREK